MSKQIRLDKYLSDMGVGSRSEVKKYIGWGRITINGTPVRQPETKVTPGVDEVYYKKDKIGYEENVYIMMNKPQGVITATEDPKQETVLDLIQGGRKKDLYPIGRLDKDTEGLLIITNDGPLGHNMLSPKKHVDKKYFAKIQGVVTEEDIEKFKEGVVLEDGYKSLPATLVVTQSGDISEIEITIIEGKYHQIKRMFVSVGKEVIYLKRISMGPIELDPTLAPGDYRALTEAELALLGVVC